MFNRLELFHRANKYKFASYSIHFLYFEEGKTAPLKNPILPPYFSSDIKILGDCRVLDPPYEVNHQWGPLSGCKLFILAIETVVCTTHLSQQTLVPGSYAIILQTSQIKMPEFIGTINNVYCSFMA